MTRGRAILSVDPSGSASGVALVQPHGAAGERPTLLGAWTVDLEREDEPAVLERVSAQLGEREWCAMIEKPFNRRGPAFGQKWWRLAIGRLARRRAEAAAVRFRKPMVMRPLPQQWRAPLGLPTQGTRALLKAVALARARDMTGAEFDSDDAAEAALMGFAGAGWLLVGDPRWVPQQGARWVW